MSSGWTAASAGPLSVVGWERWRRGSACRRLIPRRADARWIAALVAVYYLAAHIGYAFQFSGPVAAIVWLPVGVSIAFLYLGGMRLWPGVVIGDLLVNNYQTLPPGTAAATSFGNVVEALVGVMLLLRLCPREQPLSTVRGVAGMVVAIACATLLSATIGSLASWLGSVIGLHAVPYVWRTWWLGDFCGALIVLPLALAWSALPHWPWPNRKVIQALLMALLVVGVSSLQLTDRMMLSALVFPALIWAALAFGTRGATLAITVICGFAIWGATNALGPFGIGAIDERLLETQLFVATVSLSALTIAALVSERQALNNSLRESRARLVAASDEARRRLERDLHDGAQQKFLALQLRLAVTADTIVDNPREGARQVLVIQHQMDDVIQDLRTVARGVYPAILRARGIVEALKSAARHDLVDVSIRDDGLGRYSEEIEVAVYFCCLEAIQNVVKHAGADAQPRAEFREHNGYLEFGVTDSGNGFGLGTSTDGHGLLNMIDRIETVGGSLTIRSAKGHGTLVRGEVPIPLDSLDLGSSERGRVTSESWPPR